MGCQMAAYPLTLLVAPMKVIKLDLDHIKTDTRQNVDRMNCFELRNRIGFDYYYEASSRYEISYRSDGPRVLPSSQIHCIVLLFSMLFWTMNVS